MRALYSLKSSIVAWRENLADTMRSMQFTMCHADNNVWMRKAIKPNGELYYEYILIYTDDILLLSFSPELIMNKIKGHYLVKPSSIKLSTVYLGNGIGLYPSSDGKKRWYLSADTYDKNALDNLDRWAVEEDFIFKCYHKCPLPAKYQPGMDTIPPDE